GRHQANGPGVAGLLRRILFRRDRPFSETDVRPRREPYDAYPDGSVASFWHPRHPARWYWAGLLPAGSGNTGWENLSDIEAADDARRRRGVRSGVGGTTGQPAHPGRCDPATSANRRAPATCQHSTG